MAENTWSCQFEFFSLPFSLVYTYPSRRLIEREPADGEDLADGYYDEPNQEKLHFSVDLVSRTLHQLLG